MTSRLRATHPTLLTIQNPNGFSVMLQSNNIGLSVSVNTGPALGR